LAALRDPPRPTHTHTHLECQVGLRGLERAGAKAERLHGNPGGRFNVDRRAGLETAVANHDVDRGVDVKAVGAPDGGVAAALVNGAAAVIEVGVPSLQVPETQRLSAKPQGEERRGCPMLHRAAAGVLAAPSHVLGVPHTV
jgi:hypothetical protein